jgi:hypothetical protein
MPNSWLNLINLVPFLEKSMTRASTKNTTIFNFFIPFLLYLFVSLLGVFMAFYPTITSGFSKMQMDPGDTRLNNYFLEHSFQLAFNRDYGGSLWSPNFFYPFKNALALSDNLWGSAPLYWLFRGFLPSDVSFQLWMIGTTLLCFASFVILLRHFEVSHILSAAGGFLFAFGMPRMAQLGHQQLLPQFYMPFAFLFVWQFIHKPNSNRLILALIFIYLQLLAGIYLGWFLLVSLPILVAVSLYRGHALRVALKNYFTKNKKTTAAAFLVGSTAMIALLLPYMRMSRLLSGGHSMDEVSAMIPRLSSWLLPPPNSLWTFLLEPLSKDLPASHEHRLFMGFTVIALTVLSVYTFFKKHEFLGQERSDIIKACLLVTLVIFVVFLSELGLWKLVYLFVPGASAIRAVARISLVLYFFLLIAILLSLDSFLKATISNSKWRLLLSSSVCILALSEQILISPTSYEKSSFLEVEAELQGLMGKRCDLAYVSLNKDELYWTIQLSAMWAGLRAGVPVVNGYSGGVPPSYPGVDHTLTVPELQQWLKDDFKGRLCLIDKVQSGPSDGLSHYKSSIIKLPLQKVFSQEIKVLNTFKYTEVDAEIKVLLIVKNTSNFSWSSTAQYQPVHLSYHWLDSNGRIVVFEGTRTLLPFSLSPGESAALSAIVKSPNQPGKYSLILTMVQEQAAWFTDRKAQPTQINIEVKN